MYNTIEVMDLEIKKAEIKYFKKGSLNSGSAENVKHVKVLPFLSIVQSIEGSYDITLGNGEMQQTGDGGFFVAPAGVQQTIVHHINQTSGRMVCRWIFIDVEINKTYKLDSLYEFPTTLDEPVKKEMNGLFEALFSTDDFWENRSCCYKMIGLLLRLSKRSQSKMNQGVQNAVEYITKNFTQAITVHELSKNSNMSESNFYAVFKRYMGCSPIAYLNHYRLSLAADIMVESDSAISEIARAVGIHDPLYFSKLFKKHFGTSPKEYRSLYRNE